MPASLLTIIEAACTLRTGGFFTETMQRTSRTLCLTTLLFAAGAALFFTKAAVIPYKVAYPVLLLSLSLFYLRLKPLIPVGAALLLSAVGDAAGAGGMFIPQMLFFALAHGAYMCYFLPQAQVAPRPFVCLFRLRDRMGTLRRARSLPDLCRDDYLLCRAIPLLPLCRQSGDSFRLSALMRPLKCRAVL